MDRVHLSLARSLIDCDWPRASHGVFPVRTVDTVESYIPALLVRHAEYEGIISSDADVMRLAMSVSEMTEMVPVLCHDRVLFRVDTRVLVALQIIPELIQMVHTYCLIRIQSMPTIICAPCN